MRRPVLVAAAAALAGSSLAGCSAPGTTCGAGYAPTFNLTVTPVTQPELSVKFCAEGKCSPTPEEGEIPDFLTDPSDFHATFIRHTAPGQWSVRPGTGASSSGEVSLYRDGTLVSTAQIVLTWPKVDPCAPSNPPAPHVTVSAST